ncbi:NfeD family protein [Thioalkalivibrio sp. ALJ16]|uniref:NfeD family protein n=1 Tax=Thioalkalivibrio sp. ALJ16 TaxID=1158762 RepID=UPI00037E95DE|nr:NfeD family protein [Thioalkalivibrio sp. ALJ16]
MEATPWILSLDPWQYWLVLAVTILVLDLLLFGGLMSGGGGVTLILAGGALGAIIPAAFGADMTGQILGGIAGMIVMGVFVFWVGRRWVRGDDRNLSGQDVRAGREILQVEDRDGRLGVTLLGDFYPARPESENAVLHNGERVRLVRFEGITAIVTPEPQDRA